MVGQPLRACSSLLCFATPPPPSPLPPATPFYTGSPPLSPGEDGLSIEGAPGEHALAQQAHLHQQALQEERCGVSVWTAGGGTVQEGKGVAECGSGGGSR